MKKQKKQKIDHTDHIEKHPTSNTNPKFQKLSLVNAKQNFEKTKTKRNMNPIYERKEKESTCGSALVEATAIGSDPIDFVFIENGSSGFLVGRRRWVSRRSRSRFPGHSRRLVLLLLLLLWFAKLCFSTECAVCFFLRYLKRCVLIYFLWDQ